MTDWTYNAVVVDVHDGDTITVDVDLGWNTWRHHEPLRLVGLNAPELNTADGKTSRAFLMGLIAPGKPVTVRTEKDKTEKYGRMLATVFTGDVNVNELLIREGHAKPWDGKGARP